MRYAHLSEEHARDKMEEMCDLTENVTQMSPAEQFAKS